MLSWFVSDVDVERAMRKEKLDDAAVEVRPSHVSDAVLEKAASTFLSKIDDCFTLAGRLALKGVIVAKMRQRIATCGHCKVGSGDGNPIGRTVLCDGCLLLFHHRCVGLQENALITSKYWFCLNCI